MPKTIGAQALLFTGTLLSALFALSTLFLQNYLDMDLASSLKMARELSLEYRGNPMAAAMDYAKLTEFCVQEKGLDLSKPRCGKLAVRVARACTGHEGVVGGQPPRVAPRNLLKTHAGARFGTARLHNLTNLPLDLVEYFA